MTVSARYAGFWIRVAANVLDVLLLAAINQALLLATGGWQVFSGGAVRGIGTFTIALGSSQIIVAGILPPIVIIGSWIALGASPGKMMLRLRIVDEPTGGRLTVWQCIGRYVMALVAVACVGIGYLWIVIDPRKQGWHDKLVRTLVVRRD